MTKAHGNYPRSRWFALLALALAACTSGNTPAMSGGQTGEGGGPIDSCVGVRWPNPDAERETALCIRRDPPDSMLGVRTYLCSCDTAECPITVRHGDEEKPNACAAMRTAHECGAALLDACGLGPYQYGFCEARGPSDAPKPVCFAQEDGSFLCRCAKDGPLVPSNEPDCEYALRRICSATCESPAGRCEIGDNKLYRCTCANGRSDSDYGRTCPDALKSFCESER